MLLACLAVVATAQFPHPVNVQWGGHVNEEAWLWEVEGATQVVWFLPGGGWTQEPGEFTPTDLPPLMEPLYAAGVSVGVSGYNTTDAFPIPEFGIESLVAASRHNLGYDDVTLLGRSAGAHMALFNGIAAGGPGGADRVCAIQTPNAYLPAFSPHALVEGLDHFWPGAEHLSQIPSQNQLYSSSAFWPLIAAPNPERRFGIIGMPKPLEVPLLPLPYGSLTPAVDAHSAFSSQLQAYTLEAAGWNVDFVDTYNDGAPLEISVEMEKWLLAEFGL